MSQKFNEPAADTLIACDDGKHFILLEEGNDFCNWVMRRHPDGPLYSIRKATDHELAHARARQHLRRGASMVENTPLPIVTGMPERRRYDVGMQTRYGEGWNACLDACAPAFAELAALRGEAEQAKADNQQLRRAISSVYDSLEREYWSEYAGLDDTRAILDAALANEAPNG